MGFKNTIEIITKDIQELEKIIRNFENYSRIPGIEMDLALDKTRNLYELLLMIKDFNNQDLSEESGISETQKTTEQAESPQAIKEDYSQKTAPIQEDKAEFIQETEKERDREEEISEKHEPTGKTEPSKEEEMVKNKETETVSQKKDQSMKEKILAEKFQKPGDFLNEKIGAEKTKKDLSAKIQSTPIKSISGSMGINDKFFFIRELFHGNADNFNIAMKTLDDASNFNEAYNYLLNTFEWDMDSEEVQQLLNLIRRKFISSGNE